MSAKLLTLVEMLGAVYREEQRRAARVAGTVDHREQESSREEDIRK